jgi:hypothetical protein
MLMTSTVLGDTDFREKEYMLDLCAPCPGDEFKQGIFFRIDVSFNNQPDLGQPVAIGGRLSDYSHSGFSCNVSKFVSSVNVAPSGILNPPEVLVCADKTSLRTEQLAVARDLWKARISADIFYGETASVQEQLEFAQTRGVKLVVIIRERDLADHNLSLRVLVGARSKQLKEQLMKRSELVAHITHSR